MTKTYKVVGIGNAIVDVLTTADDTFLELMGIEKGIMQLVEKDRAEVLYGSMENRKQAAGGSVANTLAGIGKLGLKTGFVGRVHDDALGHFYADAMEMMLPLAEEGDRHAQYLIGFMHERGQGVPKDPAKGAEWYGRAAERGSPFAQNNLGVLYKHGRGVSQDYVMAYKWFDLAASGYLPAELGHRERAVLNQQDIVAKMTPEQVSEAQKLAEEFREANAGFADRPPRVR